MKNIDKSIKIIIIIAIVIVINLISIQLFTRIDITKGNRYSISSYSKNLVENLDDKLTIKGYFSKNIPSPYNKVRQQVKDKLSEYKAYANRYFQFEFVTPEDKQEFVKKAKGYGIPQVRVNAVEEDQAVIKNVVMGLVIMYEDRTETIPVVEKTKNLEYDISSKINKLINKELPTVGFLQGHGEIDFAHGLKQVKKQLQENYDLKAVNLSESENALNNLEVLVIAGTKEKIPLEEKYKIDQFIMEGKKVLFLVENVKADLQSRRPSAEFYKHNLQDWFKNYGFNVKKDLVYDRSCKNIRVQQMSGRTRHISFMRYPFFTITKDLNKENMIVKDLGQISLIFASSIDTTLAAEKGVDISTLASSSQQSGLQTGGLNISIQSAKNLDYNKQNIPLVTLLHGNFNSYFTNLEIPDTVNIDRSSMLRSSPENRIMVVGDAEFLQKNFLDKSNLIFFANSIDWLAQEKGLIQIRSKEISAPPLKEVKAGVRNTIKFIIKFLPTILLIIFAFIMWQLKKKRYARIRRYFP